MFYPLEKNAFRAVLAATAVAAVLSGCAMPQASAPPPPAKPNFVFTVPSTAPQMNPPMSLAFIQPRTEGSLFVEQDIGAPTPGGAPVNRTRRFVAEMLRAYPADLERILVAKGFTSSGAFPTVDEMTFTQKEHSVLILVPDLSVSVDVQGGGIGQPKTATVRGAVSLQFIEPMSKEKVWIKRLELQPFTKPVSPEPVSFADIMNKKPLNPNSISTASMADLLNTFYSATMQKVWDQLDPREVAGLKRDAEKLKSRTNYRG